MPRHIEFRHHTNSAVARIRDDLAYFILPVIQAIRSHFVQFGKSLALHTKALVLRKMPVKNVHLHGSHAVEVSFDHIHGRKVAAGVDHQPAPCKSWFVLNYNSGYGKSLWCDLD